MNAKDLKQSRVQLFRDAANFKRTERIPHFANVVTWKVFDAGYTLDQARFQPGASFPSAR